MVGSGQNVNILHGLVGVGSAHASGNQDFGKMIAVDDAVND